MHCKLNIGADLGMQMFPNLFFLLQLLMCGMKNLQKNKLSMPFIKSISIYTDLIKMARKFDRYGRNRQFRRNPTRSPKFFPYRLPFVSDYRLLDGNGTEVSAATASRWREVVRDITRGESFDRQSYRDDKRKRDIVDEFVNGMHHIRKVQKKGLGIASWGVSAPIKLEMVIAQGTKKYGKLSKAYRFVADNYGQSGKFRTYH